MAGTFLDVNAPDTAWRGGSEAPIPVIFGRYAVTAAVYRYFSCRELDGHARTDAGFIRPGAVPVNWKHANPWDYWPHWKRGVLLTRVPPLLSLYTGAVALTEHWHTADPWWLDPQGPALAWSPILGYAGTKGYLWVRDYRHNRDYVRPVAAAMQDALRTKQHIKVTIPRSMVGENADERATGRINLPRGRVIPEGDRENVEVLLRERLENEVLCVNWRMFGPRPYAELYTPAQPPALVTWDMMLGHADTVSPYLGHSATGPVHWHLGHDSPHMGIAGGSGSGKSELLAWVVAQFMRGGAGTVVLDPKYSSHRWLMRVPRVLYCSQPRMIHDTILWLDAELSRRGNVSQTSTEEFPKLVVVLEERNSLQTVLKDFWYEHRPRGARMKSPAVDALDRLASMGRSLGIHVILAAQETAERYIGSRSNYGAFCVAGRLKENSWRMIQGAGTKKPLIKGTPGRFGYVAGGETTVFQAAYPELTRGGNEPHEQNVARLIEFATSGEPLLDVAALMQQHDNPHFPSSEAVAADDPTEEYVTLAQFSARSGLSIQFLRDARGGRDRSFPDKVGTGDKNASLYRLDDLRYWAQERGLTMEDDD